MIARPVMLVSLAWMLTSSAVAAQVPRPERKGPKVQVRIESSPAGATVYLDDKAHGAVGTAPVTLQLVKGPYRVLLELAGHRSTDQIVTVDKAQAFLFHLEKAARPAVIDIRPSGDESARGAGIFVDGAVLGTVPNRIELAAGSHLVEVKREGYQDFRDTLQLAEGETRTLAVVLAPRVKPGSILVGTDVSGAEVWVDGQRRDQTPALVDGLTAGAHAVEVHKEGLPPWRQVVVVAAGQQTKVVASLVPPPPPSGSLKVLSATPAAEVMLDGEAKGGAGSEIREVRPGAHVVEVRAPGFESKRLEVEIQAQQLRVVEVDLAPAPKPGGTLRVMANLPGAEVYLDGALVGKAPLTIENVVVGQHVVELKARDHLDARQTVFLQAGQQSVVDGELKPLAPPPSQPPVPPPAVAAPLLPPPPIDAAKQRREQSAFSATSLDRFKVNVDFYAGYPYFIGARVATGIFRYRFIGADVGLELRSNIYETEVGLRPRLQLYRIDPIAVGFDLALFGGGGPEKRDAFNLELGVSLTLLAGSYVRVTFRPYLWYSTDRLCPSVGAIRDSDRDSGTIDPTTHQIQVGSGGLYQDEEPICKIYDGQRTNDYLPMPTVRVPTQTFGQLDPRNRFENTRFMLQGTLEILVTQLLNVWVTIEGAPGQKQRQAFTAKFNSAFPSSDLPLYGRAGVSLKF